jgi:hypothetical protein
MHSPQVILASAVERIMRTLVEASVDTGVADATSAVDHLDDSSKSWPVDAFANLIVEITGGTGEGQIRKIASNTATSIVPVTNFDTAPDAASTYRIGFFGKMASDITAWGGTGLTGRDITTDIEKLTAGIEVADRAARLLGVVYGSQAQQLLQRAATYDLLIQLRHNGAEVDPRAIRALTATDIVTVQSLTQWGGVALTGRDISLDLANLDLSLTALRDAICAVAPNAKTLNDLYGYLARYTQFPASLTAAGNLKLSIEEAAIASPADIQARYNVKSIRDIAPTAVGTFYLPETGSIDLSNFIASSWGIYAPTTTNMVINCYLQASHDGGTTWRRLAGYFIADADFVRDEWNTIDCPLKLAETRLEVVIGTAYPAELDLMCVRKA